MYWQSYGHLKLGLLLWGCAVCLVLGCPYLLLCACARCCRALVAHAIAKAKSMQVCLQVQGKVK